MWAYSLSVVPQTIGWWSPNPSSLRFHLPFSSIAGMERYIAAIEVWSELFSASNTFKSRYSESHASPMLTAAFAGHVLGLLPLILESPCNGQFSIWFLICSSILLYNLSISCQNISFHKEFCLQFPQKNLILSMYGRKLMNLSAMRNMQGWGTIWRDFICSLGCYLYI